MALPATITTAAEWSDFRNVPLGPYESGSNLYAVLVDKTSNRLRVYKSADGGQTWAEQDSGTTVSVTSSANTKSCWTQVIGSLLYVWYFTSQSAIAHRAFDMSTDTWGAALWSLTLATSMALLSHPSSRFPVLAARRSDGSSVVAVQGATETVMGTAYRRAKIYIVTSGGTASGPFDILGSANTPLADTLPGTQADQSLRAILLGTSDLVYIFFTDGQASPPIKMRVLGSSNTFVAAAISITGATAVAGGYDVGLPCLWTPAGGVASIALPFAFSTGGWLYVAQAPTSGAEFAANWTSVQASSIQAVDSANCNQIVLSDGATKRWAWWQKTGGADLYYVADGGAGVWGTETLWKSLSGTVVQGISATKITDGIGILYNNASGVPATPTYDRLLVFLQ
jgi:hypothetical protein